MTCSEDVSGWQSVSVCNRKREEEQRAYPAGFDSVALSIVVVWIDVDTLFDGGIVSESRAFFLEWVYVQVVMVYGGCG